MPRRPAAERFLVTERRRRAVELRLKNWPWQKIADELGYSNKQAAHKDVQRAYEQAKQLTDASLAELRLVELDRIDQIAQRVWEIVDRGHVATSGTDIVRGEDGRPMADDGPALAALRELRQLSVERRRLLGVNAPDRVEVAGTVDYTISGVDPEKL
jgi:hypothetical protein